MAFWWPREGHELFPFLSQNCQKTGLDSESLVLLTRSQYEQLYPLLRRTAVEFSRGPGFPLTATVLKSLQLQCTLILPTRKGPANPSIDLPALKMLIGTAELHHDTLLGKRGPPFNTEWSVKRNGILTAKLKPDQKLDVPAHSVNTDPRLVAAPTTAYDPDQDTASPPVNEASILGVLFTLEWLLQMIRLIHQGRGQDFVVSTLKTVSMSARMHLPFAVNTYAIRAAVSPVEISETDPIITRDRIDPCTAELLQPRSMAWRMPQIFYQPTDELFRNFKLQLPDSSEKLAVDYRSLWMAVDEADLRFAESVLKDNPPSWLALDPVLVKSRSERVEQTTLNKVMISIGHRTGPQTVSTTCARSFHQISLSMQRVYRISAAGRYLNRLAQTLLKTLRRHTIELFHMHFDEPGRFFTEITDELARSLEDEHRPLWQSRQILEWREDEPGSELSDPIFFQSLVLDAVKQSLLVCSTHEPNLHRSDGPVFSFMEDRKKEYDEMYERLLIEEQQRQLNMAGSNKKAKTVSGLTLHQEARKKLQQQEKAKQKPLRGRRKRDAEAAWLALQWTPVASSEAGKKKKGEQQQQQIRTAKPSCLVKFLCLHLPDRQPETAESDTYFQSVLDSHQFWDFIKLRQI